MVKCPGQDTRKLTVNYHPCPNCGHKVEFFSDEIVVRCPKCRTEVCKDQMPNCVQWRQAARQCVGPERYDEMMRQMKAVK